MRRRVTEGNNGLKEDDGMGSVYALEGCGGFAACAAENQRIVSQTACRGRVRPGDSVVMTKWAGLEGSAMLAERFRERLLMRYPAELIDTAREFRHCLSVTQETAAAAAYGVSGMCAVAEGGVFKALWRLAECAEVGLSVFLKKIPIRQETVEICNWLNINPYELTGNGSLLCLALDGERLAEMFLAEGIPAAVIGCVEGGRDRVVLNGEDKRFLSPRTEDAIYRVWRTGRRFAETQRQNSKKMEQ